jgi:adenylyltransferase/sulfurtransferase
LYGKKDIGKLKCFAAREKLNGKISALPVHLTEENVHLINADLVLDCTDNLETRFIINEYCNKMRIPWVHAAASGSIGVVLPITGNYCFNCVYGGIKNGLPCENDNILPQTAWATASLQVTEALKILMAKPHANALIRFDTVKNTCDFLRVKKNPECSVCNGLNKPKQSLPFTFTVSRCKTRAAYSAKPINNITLNLNNIKQKFTTIIDTPIALVIKEDNIEIIVHSHGELVFKNFYDEKKIKRIAENVYGIGL